MKLKLTCTKMKDHEPPEPMFFLPKVMSLGFIESDDPDDLECATSVVLNLSMSQNASAPPPPKLTQPQELVLKVLRELLVKNDGGKVYIDAWKDAAMSESISESSNGDSKRRAFNRARTDLLNKGLILTANDYYWVQDTETVARPS